MTIWKRIDGPNPPPKEPIVCGFGPSVLVAKLCIDYPIYTTVAFDHNNQLFKVDEGGKPMPNSFKHWTELPNFTIEDSKSE